MSFKSIGWSGCDSRRGLGIFLFDTKSRPPLRATHRPVKWVPVSLSLGVKLTTHVHLMPWSKNGWSYTSTPTEPPWRGAQLKHTDNCTFTFYCWVKFCWEYNECLCNAVHIYCLFVIYTYFVLWMVTGCNNDEINVDCWSKGVYSISERCHVQSVAVREHHDMYEGKSKSKGTSQKKHMYCKYTETKLILLLDVIPFDFNAPVPAFHKLFNPVGKKKVFWLRF